MVGPVSAPGSGRGPAQPVTLAQQQTATAFFAVVVANDAPISTKPYFSRAAFTENRYTLSDPSSFGRPFNAAPLVAVARYSVGGVPVEMTSVVRRREPNLPYGDVIREVRTVPRIGVSVSPPTAVIPMSSTTRTVNLDVVLVHNASAPTSGQVFSPTCRLGVRRRRDSLRVPARRRAHDLSLQGHGQHHRHKLHYRRGRRRTAVAVSRSTS
jgi:hypothetical protein